jgi:hypothetical protein
MNFNKNLYYYSLRKHYRKIIFAGDTAGPGESHSGSRDFSKPFKREKKEVEYRTKSKLLDFVFIYIHFKLYYLQLKE